MRFLGVVLFVLVLLLLQLLLVMWLLLLLGVTAIVSWFCVFFRVMFIEASFAPFTSLQREGTRLINHAPPTKARVTLPLICYCCRLASYIVPYIQDSLS